MRGNEMEIGKMAIDPRFWFLFMNSMGIVMLTIPEKDGECLRVIPLNIPPGHRAELFPVPHVVALN